MPKFKKKGKSKDSFLLTGVILLFPEVKQVQLPRSGKLRLKEKPNLSTSARILSVSVSRTADHWYVAITMEEEQSDHEQRQFVIIKTVCNNKDSL